MRLRVLILLSLFLTATYGAADASGPCKCEDIKKVQDQIARVSKAEEAWKQIFGWARGLRSSVGRPQSNDDMNNKFAQLMNTPAATWEDVMSHVSPSQDLTKIGGLNDAGEVIVDNDFVQANCDDIVEGERVHER